MTTNTTFYEAIAAENALDDREVYEQLNYEDSQRVWDLYKDLYNKADDHEPDAFDTFSDTPAKSTVVRDYCNYIKRGIVRAYVEKFTSDELDQLILFLGRCSPYASIKLSENVTAGISELKIAAEK